jgi:signal transduction histidine kinase
LALLLSLVVVYFLGARLGLSMAFAAEQVTAVWPPTGIALAAVLLFGRRVWPAITVGAFLANLTSGAPAAVALGIAAGNTLEAVIAGWLLQRALCFSSSLAGIKDVLGLAVFGAGLSTMVSATVGVTSLCLGGVEPWSKFASLWSLWWLGDAVGDLVIAPLLLTAACSLRTWEPGQRVRYAEAAILLVLFSVICLIVFAGAIARGVSHHPLEYVLFPFIIWAALRFGQLGTSVLTFVAAGIAIWGTLRGFGPFADGSVHESLILLTSYMAVVALTGLLLAATMHERNLVARRQADDHAVTQALYAQLREANRHKDEFLALLGHELRNPLAPIRNGLEVLKLPGADPAITERARQMIERQVEHMVRLVDDLLDVSRIIRGKIELRREAVELATVVARAVESSQPLIEAEGHELTVGWSSEPLWLNGDPVRLAQIVGNLLSNAARYTEKGGRIWLTIGREQQEAVLKVRDTGIGIARDVLPRIFEMFFQAQRNTKDAQGGLGIGLSLVRGLVEMHGGRIDAYSAGPGKGSEFVVRLPLMPSEAGEGRRTEVYDRKGVPPRRVLVVDDNQDAADSLAMLLRLDGHHVEAAYDGPSALRQAEENPPGVVFLDLGMPHMDGYELARCLRAQPALQGTLLVAVTGWGQPEDRQRTKEAGFDHHLVKPVERDALRGVLC